MYANKNNIFLIKRKQKQVPPTHSFVSWAHWFVVFFFFLHVWTRKVRSKPLPTLISAAQSKTFSHTWEVGKKKKKPAWLLLTWLASFVYGVIKELILEMCLRIKIWKHWRCWVHSSGPDWQHQFFSQTMPNTDNNNQQAALWFIHSECFIKTLSKWVLNTCGKWKKGSMKAWKWVI